QLPKSGAGAQRRYDYTVVRFTGLHETLQFNYLNCTVDLQPSSRKVARCDRSSARPPAPWSPPTEAQAAPGRLLNRSGRSLFSGRGTIPAHKRSSGANSRSKSYRAESPVLSRTGRSSGDRCNTEANSDMVA